MSAKEVSNAKRRFSLNILTGSKTTEERPKIWTTQNDNPENLSHTTNGKITFNKPSAEPRKKKTPKAKSTKSRGPPVKQVSEIQLSWSERYLSWRYVMTLLLQFSFVVAIFLRNCMPMALVCMVKPRGLSSTSNRTEDGSNTNFSNTGLTDLITSREDWNSLNNGNASNNNDLSYEFDWDSDVQGLVLTSILFTSFLGPLLVAFIVGRLGSKLTLTLSNLTSCLLTMLSPTAARINPYFLVTLRMLLGITMGANVPVIGDSLAWWSPQAEKLTMVAMTFTGINIGGILASSISGFLCYIPLDNGWPFIFYIFGIFSLIWGIAWHFLSSQKPEDHPYISEKEKNYIVSHRIGMETTEGGKTEKPPYRKILTSVPVLAFLATASCHLWSSNLIFTYLPAYFTDILGFSIQATGLLVSLVSVSRMSGTFIWTTVGNKLMIFFSTNRVRKMCICAGFTMGAASQVGVAFFNKDDKWVAFGLLILVMICQAVGSCTLTVVPLDMAPRYGGFLTGLFVSVGSCVSISGPLLTAAITTNGTYEEWRTVWIIMGAVFLAASLIFGFFGESKLQSWGQVNKPNLPHIVSPFITMGRRFSAFMDAPPLSPASPISDQKFDFSIAIQASAAAVAPGLATPTPETNIAAMNFHQEIPTPNGGTDIVPDSESYSNGEENGVENEDEIGVSNTAFEIDESYIPARKRAYSEFGLQVLRPRVEEEIPVDKPNIFLDNNLMNRKKDNEQNGLVLSVPTRTDEAQTQNAVFERGQEKEKETRTFECTRM